MEHIAVERHFPHIGAHVADARLGHALLYLVPLRLGQHDVEMDGAAALFHRSSRSSSRSGGG